ncbi:MAG: GNAT family N-acetyltransferase [Amylibacter sp.]
MITIPTLETERLILRAPSEDDHSREVLFYGSDHAKFVGGQRSAMGAWDAIVGRLGHWVMRGYGFWHLVDRETGQYVGRCGFINPFGWPEREIGWSLMPDALGDGYATEAAIAVRNYAYNTLGWTTAISLIDPASTPSKGVAERLGASCETTFEHIEFGTMHIWRHPSAEDLK